MPKEPLYCAARFILYVAGHIRQLLKAQPPLQGPRRHLAAISLLFLGLEGTQKERMVFLCVQDAGASGSQQSCHNSTSPVLPPS